MAVLLDGQTQARAQMGVNVVCHRHKSGLLSVQHRDCVQRFLASCASVFKYFLYYYIVEPNNECDI